MRAYRAISPVIATIIIIAVTIAIAVAVAGWIMGLWSGYTAKPALNIYDAKLVNNTGTLYMFVRNDGSGDAVFQLVRAGSIDCTDPQAIYKDGTQVSGYNAVVIKPGESSNVTIVCPAWAGQFIPGSTTTITVITKDGSKFTGAATVVAR